MVRCLIAGAKVEKLEDLTVFLLPHRRQKLLDTYWILNQWRERLICLIFFMTKGNFVCVCVSAYTGGFWWFRQPANAWKINEVIKEMPDVSSIWQLSGPWKKKSFDIVFPPSIVFLLTFPQNIVPKISWWTSTRVVPRGKETILNWMKS